MSRWPTVGVARAITVVAALALLAVLSPRTGATDRAPAPKIGGQLTILSPTDS